MDYIVYFDKNDYAIWFFPKEATIYTEPSDKKMELTVKDLDEENMDCYFLDEGKLKFDKKKKQSKIEPPTWQENLESQVFYTAMMTDTLIEE